MRVAARARIGERDRRQQRLGVGVPRRGVQRRACRRDLDDLAEIHHRDAVADVLHHGEIVGDEQVGQAELALQVLQQVDDLRLDRDVERGDRLVADDQLGLDRERAGDADALALAAGELVRIALRVLGRAGRPAQQLARRAARAAAPVRQRRGWRSGSARISPTVMRGLSEA